MVLAAGKQKMGIQATASTCSVAVNIGSKRGENGFDMGLERWYVTNARIVYLIKNQYQNSRGLLHGAFR